MAASSQHAAALWQFAKPTLCANACPNAAITPCKKACGLVAYCSEACHAAHEKVHQKDCDSIFSKHDWQPFWLQSKHALELPETDDPPEMPSDYPPREPKWAEGSLPLWGKVPAVDILNLEKNEGADYENDLRLLITASADFRNVLKTISSLPSSFSKQIHCTINDKNPAVVFRNALFMLILALEKDKELAVDAVIHIWYSAKIKPKHAAILARLSEELAHWVRRDSVTTNGPITLSIQAGPGSVSVTLDAVTALEFANTIVPAYDSNDEFLRRSRLWCCMSRTDLTHQPLALFSSRLHRRVAKAKFRRSGILLPFGESEAEFSVYNPTLYARKFTPGGRIYGQWAPPYHADPLDGWSDHEIDSFFKTVTPGPDLLENDLYGKLRCFLNDKLSELHTRLREGDSFTFVCENALELPALLLDINKGYQRFDRVYVPTLVDLDDELRELPLVETLRLARFTLSMTNPRAVLITAHYKQILKVRLDRETDCQQWELRLAEASRRFGLPYPDIDEYFAQQDLDSFRIDHARTFFGYHNGLFAHWMVEEKKDPGMSQLSLILKATNTVIDKWPFRPKLGKDDPGAAKELEDLNVSGAAGTERYCEWAFVEPQLLPGEDRERVGLIEDADREKVNVVEDEEPEPELSRTQKINKRNRERKKLKMDKGLDGKGAQEDVLEKENEEVVSETEPSGLNKTRKNNRKRAEKRRAKKNAVSDGNNAGEKDPEAKDLKEDDAVQE